jgi:hypothetical protein
MHLSTAPSTTLSTTLSRILLTALLAMTTSCGGVGVPAPHVLAPDEDTGCPATAELLSSTSAAVDRGAVDALRPHLRRVLNEEGGLRTTVAALVVVLRTLKPGDLDVVGRALGGADTGGLAPALAGVLQYMNGTSESAPGPHDDLLLAVHDVLSSCDAPESLLTLRRILELEVTFDAAGVPRAAAPGTGSVTWVGAVFDASLALTAEPAVRDALDKIELTDSQGSGGVTVGKDAFRALARLVSGNVAAPGFDLGFTRRTVDDLLIRALPADGGVREKLDRLLGLLQVAVDPTNDIFPLMQGFMACVNRYDANAAVPAALFDALKTGQVSTLLQDVVNLDGGGAARESLRRIAIGAMRALEAQPGLISDVTRIPAQLTGAPAGPAAVKALVGLVEAGALDDVLAAAKKLEGCSR